MVSPINSIRQIHVCFVNTGAFKTICKLSQHFHNLSTSITKLCQVSFSSALRYLHQTDIRALLFSLVTSHLTCHTKLSSLVSNCDNSREKCKNSTLKGLQTNNIQIPISLKNQKHKNKKQSIRDMNSEVPFIMEKQ